MKKKVKEEFKLKSVEEFKKLFKDSQDLLFKLRLDKAQNKLKNQKQIFWERKKAALFLTLINEKEKVEKVTKDREMAKIKEEKEGAK